MSGGGAGKGKGGGGGGGGAKGKAGGGGAAGATQELNNVVVNAERRLSNAGNAPYSDKKQINGIASGELKNLANAHKKNMTAINNEVKKLEQARKDAPRGAAKKEATRAEDRAKIARAQYRGNYRQAQARINAAAAKALRAKNEPLNKTQQNALRDWNNIRTAALGK